MVSGTYVSLVDPSVKGRLRAEINRRRKPRCGESFKVVDDWDEEKVIFMALPYSGENCDKNKAVEWYWYRFNPEEAEQSRNWGKSQPLPPPTNGADGSTCLPPPSPTAAFLESSLLKSFSVYPPYFNLQIWFNPAFPDVAFYDSAAMHAILVNADLNAKQINLKPALPQLALTRSSISFVTLGTKIYVLPYKREYCGSRRRFREEKPPMSGLMYIDTLQPEKGWRETPPMVCRTSDPVVVAVDGKIYAFGDFDSSHRNLLDPSRYENFGEVFDPILGLWESIPVPPLEKLSSHMISPSLAVITDLHGIRKGILVHFLGSGSLYVYRVDSKKWVVFDTNFRRESCLFAAVNGFLFCYSELQSRMLGYDLINKTWKPVEFPPGDFPDRYKGNCPALFHLGSGNLCILWKEFERVRYVGFTVEDHETRLLGTVTHLGSLAFELPCSYNQSVRQQ